MLLGAGVDLIEKERFAGWLERPGVRRRFAPEELAYAAGFASPGRQQEAMAAAFAAKEAFYKAAAGVLGEKGLEPGLLWAASVRHEPSGRPVLWVAEPWAGRLQALGAGEFFLSISHDRSQVLAVVLIGSGKDFQQEIGEKRLLNALIPAGFLPLAQAEGEVGEVNEVNGELAANWLPLRRRNSHKGDYGHVTVVGGSRLYLGAPRMAAEAALKAGAGLVTLAVPVFIYPISPEIMRLPLPDFGGVLGLGALKPLRRVLREPGRVLALGMGLGRTAGACQLAERLAAEPVPKVIDADGLFALAARRAEYEAGLHLPEDTVLTPHSGEMARLLGITPAEVEADRLRAVRLCARTYGAVTVLKGPDTLICGPEDRAVYRNTTGNPGMASGGSGDVLAGLIAAWLGQGRPAGLGSVAAAALAVYLHGLAGDLAAAAKSEYALSAMDIVEWLPRAYKQLLQLKGV